MPTSHPYLHNQQEAEQKVIALASHVASTDRVDASEVFGVKGLPGDPASLAISRRDAGDRVAQAESNEERREMLARATRSGDEVMARAIAQHATEGGDAKTMEQFIADRPNLEAAAQRVWNAEHAGARGMGFAFALMGLLPQELSGSSRYQIEKMAGRVA